MGTLRMLPLFVLAAVAPLVAQSNSLPPAASATTLQVFGTSFSDDESEVGFEDARLPNDLRRLIAEMVYDNPT